MTNKSKSETFGFGRVARLSGVRRATLDVWAKTGFLAPSVKKAAGTGSTRAYSARDVVAARVANRLRQAGVELEGLRHIVAFVQKSRSLKDPPAGTRLIVTGKSCRVARGEDELLKAFRRVGSRDALVIDIGGAAEEIRRGLKEDALLKAAP